MLLYILILHVVVLNVGLYEFAGYRMPYQYGCHLKYWLRLFHFSLFLSSSLRGISHNAKQNAWEKTEHVNACFSKPAVLYMFNLMVLV
jgi:disulfide bond formation protein DsbB